MNLIVVCDSDIRVENGEKYVTITDDRRVSHIRHVLRAEIGKELKLGIKNSTVDTATVVLIDKSRVELRLSPAFASHQQPKEPLVDLVLGLPRPKSLDKLLQYTTSIGVRRIKLVCSSRVELDYLKSHQLNDERIEESLTLGMEQGVTTFMPKVELFRSLGALQRNLKDDTYRIKLIAHPDTENTLGSLGIHKLDQGPILVAIGPEGGWVDSEVSFYKDCGFKPFNVGETILRTEVASVAILAQLKLLLSDTTLRGGLPKAR
ncbi:ribosomal RNA small subunit methyltransferase E like protein [Babesia gibsoni]|uniref:16S rRNA (uracil(1498)-N(3))-methyltransferase n=1 Tax=Babesia gibsoni TaxID=33632 RepID=A0AAD8PH32_BABGI|nr:ribosomal RNA small subunit methyltransferase E like protein [Babesia gibsoni]